ncbi:single-stranded DNA binding protein [Halococcus saccharolyticus]|uniref:Replication factor A n=1 Tax=Halococcus saccharolyticus DSM 5350 TaxID=1227455 RepID=M0MEM9_9EURY|nr:single-stranded DNA binding protein [Halococcus saccharolyticus]EMA44181.1 replication factor A [Halococcus saccharolyticus DSM 5350]
MGAIEEIYADLDADVPEGEFREAVEEKVEEMGGLADEETAAMLIAHEVADGEVEGVADVEPGMEEAKFVAKVTSVGELRTFERDGEDEDGQVINVEVADETGQIRVAFWDERAESAAEELETGSVLKIAGRPREGYNGIEISADRVEPADVEVDVDLDAADTIAGLSLGQSDVDLVGLVLDTDTVRTFDRDDGSEGRVANLTLGDETGRTRVTLWDDQAGRVEELTAGTTIELTDGYVRERNGDLELHVGDRGGLTEVDATVEYTPETTPIEDLEIDTTVDIGGVIRSTDPKRTFDRDDGSEGQVKNIRVQDETGDIRVALWGEKADRDLGPGDEVQFADVEIQDGWQDDLEASAGWQTSVTTFDTGGVPSTAEDDETSDDETGLGAFTGDGANSENGTTTDGHESETEREAADTAATDAATTDATTENGTESGADDGPIEFTGTVVQASDPVVLDNGSETMRIETSATVHLGEELTARGREADGALDADEVF